MTDRDPNTGKFVSGVSGNLKGRPLSLAPLIDACVTDDDWRAMFLKLKSMALHGSLKAMELLLDRRFGKALQQSDVNLTGEVSLLVWDIQPPAKKSE